MSGRTPSRRAEPGAAATEARYRPVYARVLGLRHLRPGGMLCFVYFEGAIALGLLLALAELVSWWVVLILPVSIALMVKVNDLVAGAVARSTARTPERERERLRREVIAFMPTGSHPTLTVGKSAAGAALTEVTTQLPIATGVSSAGAGNGAVGRRDGSSANADSALASRPTAASAHAGSAAGTGANPGTNAVGGAGLGGDDQSSANLSAAGTSSRNTGDGSPQSAGVPWDSEAWPAGHDGGSWTAPGDGRSARTGQDGGYSGTAPDGGESTAWWDRARAGSVAADDGNASAGWDGGPPTAASAVGSAASLTEATAQFPTLPPPPDDLDAAAVGRRDAAGRYADAGRYLDAAWRQHAYAMAQHADEPDDRHGSASQRERQSAAHHYE